MLPRPPASWPTIMCCLAPQRTHLQHSPLEWSCSSWCSVCRQPAQKYSWPCAPLRACMIRPARAAQRCNQLCLHMSCRPSVFPTRLEFSARLERVAAPCTHACSPCQLRMLPLQVRMLCPHVFCASVALRSAGEAQAVRVVADSPESAATMQAWSNSPHYVRCPRLLATRSKHLMKAHATPALPHSA